MLTIEFSNQFTRAQIRTQLGGMVAAFPLLTISVMAETTLSTLAETPDTELTLIIGLKADGFTTIQELGDFLSALPGAINGRFNSVVYKP
jgi:hypothetical protein